MDGLDKEPGGADTASNNISLDNSIADDLEYKLGGEDLISLDMEDHGGLFL